MNKRGLGRGLGALIPDASTYSPQVGEMILSLEIDTIEPNPHQPRRDFRDEDLAALATSIREEGVLQPILVRQPSPGRYQIVAGERRWRAAKLAGFDQIPAIVRDTREEQLLPLALVENLVRADLNPVEEALAYRDLAEEAGWSHSEIADRVGRSRSHVANAIRLLQLPPEILADVSHGRLTAGHARSILACDGDREAMLRLRDAILAGELSVREAEDRAAAEQHAQGNGAATTSSPGRPRKKSRAREQSPEARELEEKLTRMFGTPAQLHERSGRGRVSFEFYSYDDLQRLTDLLFLAGNRGGFGI
ncbi:MAG: ParB/RepB/Spo0J family partition protein [bacterium]